MNVAPVAMPRVVASPSAPAPGAPVAVTGPAPEEPKVAGVRAGVADALRAVGSGYAEYADKNAAVVDNAMIYPVESVHAVGTLYKAATGNIPYVKKTGFVFTALGYLAAVQNLVASSLVRAPAQFANDLTHIAADAIDGKKSFDRSIGLFTLPPVEPKDRAPRSDGPAPA